MARGSAEATQGARSGNRFALANQGNAQGIFTGLEPALMAEAIHPAGFGPTDLAAMNTAAQQEAGGMNAGVVGQGALLKARTRNAGAAQGAMAAGARGAQDELMKAGLRTQLENAELKQQQRSGAERALASLYGTGVEGANASLRNVAENVDADTKRRQQSWDWVKYILDPAMQAAGSMFKAGF